MNEELHRNLLIKMQTKYPDCLVRISVSMLSVKEGAVLDIEREYLVTVFNESGENKLLRSFDTLVQLMEFITKLTGDKVSKANRIGKHL